MPSWTGGGADPGTEPTDTEASAEQSTQGTEQAAELGDTAEATDDE